MANPVRAAYMGISGETPRGAMAYRLMAKRKEIAHRIRTFTLYMESPELGLEVEGLNLQYRYGHGCIIIGMAVSSWGSVNQS